MNCLLRELIVDIFRFASRAAPSSNRLFQIAPFTKFAMVVSSLMYLIPPMEHHWTSHTEPIIQLLSKTLLEFGMAAPGCPFDVGSVGVLRGNAGYCPSC
jgi:hypothetical protein